MSAIEWTSQTWNPVIGCARVSEGCRNCYAETMARRIATMGGPAADRYLQVVKVDEAGAPRARWNGRALEVPSVLDKPLGWRKPQRVFVNSMSDLFHEDVSDEYIAAVFGVMAATPRHTYQILTKRPERARAWMNHHLDDCVELGDGAVLRAVWQAAHALGDGSDADHDNWHHKLCQAAGAAYGTPWPLPNVWLGVSVEDQATADARIPDLLACPAAVRFVSYEPSLAPVDFGAHLSSLSWVIVGGESGPGARPFDVWNAWETVRQCNVERVPVFVKQLGAKPFTTYYDDATRAHVEASGHEWPWPTEWREEDGQPPCDAVVPLKLRSRKGNDPTEWPEDLRVRQFPGEAV